MWVSYNLWSNSGVDHCYDNLALVVGGGDCARACVCVYMCVHGVYSKAFCQMAGCCCKWETLFWRPVKVVHFIKDKRLQRLIQVFNRRKLSFNDVLNAVSIISICNKLAKIKSKVKKKKTKQQKNKTAIQFRHQTLKISQYKYTLEYPK